MPDPSRIQRRTFGALLGLTAVLFLWTVSPIWVPLFLGALLAVVASPLLVRLERRPGRHRRLLAAGISAVTVGLGVALVFLLGFVVLREFLAYLTGNGPEHAHRVLDWLHSRRVARLLGYLGQSPDELVETG